ncbi:glycosyltransferase 6 domain-containing protein 1-like [Meles meles]|uniref:glycosyltransferase 6 domain-containing protein 1-like n=1 Tax=Meles meles TaxID=9662 RepID=UPI001E69B0DA|nr:glycosyltransferase 6 domain-containing protein 1-like [Meles meles]
MGVQPVGSAPPGRIQKLGPCISSPAPLGTASFLQSHITLCVFQDALPPAQGGDPPRNDVLVLIPWLAPVVWKGSSDTDILNEQFRPQNATIGLTVFAIKKTRCVSRRCEASFGPFLVQPPPPPPRRVPEQIAGAHPTAQPEDCPPSAPTVTHEGQEGPRGGDA